MGPLAFEGLVKKTETGCRPDQLFGAWAVEVKRFAAMVDRAKKVDLATLKRADGDVVIDVEPPEPGPLPYKVENRVAIIDVTGPLTKYQTSFQAVLGGTSTVAVRQTLRAAVGDPKVGAIMLRIDSPGGTVAGTMELADAVRAADAKKPTATYIEDLGCSAAYWVAAMGRKGYANAAAEVGSIGTFAVLEDTSGLYEAAGVKVYVVSSAPLKGAGVDGTPITPELLEEVQRQIDAFTGLFVKGVASGRRLPIDQVRQLADGRVHIAAEAKRLGLIDAVATFEDATKELRKAMENDEALAKAQTDNATLRAENEALKGKVATFEKAAVAADPKAALSPEARALVEAAEKDAAEAKAKLAEITDKALTAQFEGKVTGLKVLGVPVAFAQTLKAIHGWKPEAAAAVEQVLRAADEQAAKGALFGQVGATGAAGDTGAAAFDKATTMARKLVAEGKAKSVSKALEQVWTAHPDLYKQHVQERDSSATKH